MYKFSKHSSRYFKTIYRHLNLSKNYLSKTLFAAQECTNICQEDHRSMFNNLHLSSLRWKRKKIERILIHFFGKRIWLKKKKKRKNYYISLTELRSESFSVSNVTCPAPPPTTMAHPWTVVRSLFNHFFYFPSQRSREHHLCAV